MENRPLHSENFDLCRICLLEPESNRSMTFFPIFGDDDRSVMIRQKITELLHVKVERNDVKPKIICSCCRESILTWSEMKKKAAEAQIVINYIAKKRFGLITSSQSTSNDTGSSPELKNNTISTTTPRLPLHSETAVSKVSSHSETRPISQFNSYSGSNQQDRSFGQSFTANHSTPVAVRESDNTSCHEVPISDEVIYVSSDSEDYEDNFKQNPSDKDVVRYCSICKVKRKYNHECSAYNKDFCTCMVPNCNILFRTMRDFDPHYRQHIGFSPREWICRRCFKENKKTERDANGRHICRSTENLFKCYTCNIVLNNMAEFANHKLKKHNGRLINSNGKFLCFYCEKSSPDMMYIDEHMKQFHYKKSQSRQESTVEGGTKHKESKVSETIVTTNDKNVSKKTVNPGIKNVSTVQLSYKQLLFTCLKPSCNLIFQYFPNFKFHHRQHFNTGDCVMCWQCCTPFSSVTDLRAHQVKDNCRTPGMFKCHECSEVFDDIQCLSIHKFTLHNGQLVIQKRGQQNVICPSCRSSIGANSFRGHLIHCYTPNNKSSKNTKSVSTMPKIALKQSKLRSTKCGVCGKVCSTVAALTSHIKVHNPDRDKAIMKKKVNTNKFDLGFVETNKGTNSTPSSSSKNNETSKYIDSSIDDQCAVNTSSTRKITSKKIIDYNQFPFINGVYHCIKCPRQFNSRMGLAKHWPFCKIKKIVKLSQTNSADPTKILPKNYYCTDCKEYFTRVGFGSHFISIHGKKLGLNKTKRFSCTKCSHKFLYKVALLMHYQHVHGELENPVKNVTNADGIVKLVDIAIHLPIVSEATSLATGYTGKPMDKIEETCDQQIKEEINNTMSSDVLWEDDGMDSFNNGQDNNLGDSGIDKELVNDDNVGDMSNAPSVTQNVEVNDNEMAVEQLDPESSMEVDNVNEIENNIEASESEENIESHELEGNIEPHELEGNIESHELEGNIESHELEGNIESHELEKNNESHELEKNIESHELEENIESHELEENIQTNELDKNDDVNPLEKNNEVNPLEKNNEVLPLEKNNESKRNSEANGWRKSDNMEVTTTSNDKINNVVTIKKEYIHNRDDEKVKVNETLNVNQDANISNSVVQEDNAVMSSKEPFETNGLNDN